MSKYKVRVMKKNNMNEPKYIPSPLKNQMINYKVYYMSALEKIIYFLITFLIGGIAGYIFYGGLFKYEGEATTATYISNIVVFVVVGMIAAKFFVPAIRKHLKEKRAKKLQKQFMDFMEVLAASLAAGNTLKDSFVNAKKDLLNQYLESDMIIIELSEIISGLDNGITLETMLDNFGDRSNNDDIQNFSNVMSNCYRLGGDFKSVVRRTRDIISDKIAVSEEITTKISSNKLQHNVMCIMPIVLVAMLKLASPSFANNLASFIGVFVTTIAFVIFIISYFWGQKIVDIR